MHLLKKLVQLQAPSIHVTHFTYLCICMKAGVNLGVTQRPSNIMIEIQIISVIQ